MSINQTWLINGEHRMHCGGCVQTVKFTLSQVSGVIHVKADQSTQLIEVEMNKPQVSELVVSELDNLGYEVMEIDNDNPIIQT